MELVWFQSTWQNLANKGVFSVLLLRDNAQREHCKMRSFPSEMQFYDGKSAKTIFTLGWILSPLRLPFRHIGGFRRNNRENTVGGNEKLEMNAE